MKRKTGKYVRIQLHITPEQDKKLHKMAKADKVSISEWMRVLIGNV